MSANNDGGPAFPHTRVYNDSAEIAGGVWKEPGMTLRDWFAGQALAGTTSEGEAMKFFMAKGKNEYAAAYKLLAEDSYAIADAMLAARSTKGTP